MENIWQQASSLIWIVLTGIVWGAYFDLSRAKRCFQKRSSWRTGLDDLMFWVGSLAILTTGMILGNWMEIRVYVLVGLAVGYFTYAGLMRPILFPIFKRSFQVLGFILFPIRRIHERIVFRRRLWWRRRLRRAAKQRNTT